MSTTIRHKRTNVPGKIPSPNDIDVGELAINMADKKIYSKDSNNNIIDFALEGQTNFIFLDGGSPSTIYGQEDLQFDFGEVLI